MKKLPIFTIAFVFTVLWSAFVWDIDDGVKIESLDGDQLHSELATPSAVLFGKVHTLSAPEEKFKFDQLVFEGCEYFTTNLLNEKSWTHKGNCKNIIHPENTINWDRFNKLLNSPMLQGILGK